MDERANADELSSLISQMGYDAPLINDQSNDVKQKNYESKKRDEALHWIHSTRKQVFINLIHNYDKNSCESSCNRIVVSTSRCGRDNPGSNPGYSILFLVSSIDRPRKAVCRPRIKISQ